MKEARANERRVTLPEPLQKTVGDAKKPDEKKDDETRTEEERASAEPKKRRRLPLKERRKHNKLRYAGILPDDQLPPGHLLNHSPPDHRCKTCGEIWGGVAPAARLTEEEKARKPKTKLREKIHVDCWAVEEEDINGHDSLLVTKCDATEYPKVLPLADK